jgi:hypothetical protein
MSLHLRSSLTRSGHYAYGSDIEQVGPALIELATIAWPDLAVLRPRLGIKLALSQLPSELGWAMERKLAAILATDIVGYSRLIEADEAGTFDRMRAHRKEVFEPQRKSLDC